MGLFDLPEPLFTALDTRLAAFVPDSLRLVIWALLAAAVSMALYRWLSPQSRIARLKREAAEARRALNEHDGNLDEAAPLMRRMLRLSLLQMGAVTGPAVLASLPILCLLVWLSTAYGYRFPDLGADVPVETRPVKLRAAWRPPAGAGAARLELSDERGALVDQLELRAPVPVIHKWQWWNALIGNPAGYVPDDAPYDSVELTLPRREYLPLGPGWARGWELPFFLVLVLGSVAIKVIFRVQ